MDAHHHDAAHLMNPPSCLSTRLCQLGFRKTDGGQADSVVPSLPVLPNNGYEQLWELEKLPHHYTNSAIHYAVSTTE